MMDIEKHVDESWKDSVANEKAGCSDEGCGCSKESCGEESCGDGCGCGEGEMEVNFFNYLTSMGYQAMIFLGEIPNPMTGENQKNLRQAKFIIDTLLLIQEKTKGNLTEQENSFLDGTLYELQMKFVELAKKGEILT
ncbi:MAG: DUF1844 domain-containing protein [Candidatus Omnitrophica bacterium]|nr:DUF1844 domain-containing protein [Candidatus Omnitrophota bacterium]